MAELLDEVINGKNIHELSVEQEVQLCKEIREFLIQNVIKTGGHLSSNLGTVELMVAIHHVYDTEKDRLILDVGHQCYTHKILSGRADLFPTLRQYQGLSGFCKPEESNQDAFISGHASNSVSVALGMARARTALGEDYQIVTVIGDGALTGGLAYEALNDAGQSGESMVVILNDNGMSIDRNVGALGKYLNKIRMKSNYGKFKDRYHRIIFKIPGGKWIYRGFHRVKEKIKSLLLPGEFFEDIGFTYIGPIDGHDLKTLSSYLEQAKAMKRPVLLHVKTIKGKGYTPAEKNPGFYHGISKNIDPDLSPAVSYSSVMGDKLIKLAKEDPKIIAITPAMIQGSCLNSFQAQFPNRIYDVGIAEEHAVAMAGGMAKQGLKPICVIYSTFLQRSFDMIIHDVCLQNLPVVFAVDRAGLVGEDGPTHHGVFDVSYLSLIPNLTIYSPASYSELCSYLEKAFQSKGPVVIRYPKGSEGDYKDNRSFESTSVLCTGNDLTLVTYGKSINTCLKVHDELLKHNLTADVIKINTLKPLNIEPVLKSCSKTLHLLVLEEGTEIGGIGQQIQSALFSEHAEIKSSDLLTLGDHFIPHGDNDSLLKAEGLDADSIIQRILKERSNEQEGTT